MKKRLILLFVCLLTTLSFSKNIFVVYDDSKSMNKDNRSVYANYAMQTLISLLEEDDNLVIVKMSDVDNQFRNKLVIDLKKIPDEIEYFREKINPKSNVTPYKAVESIVDYIAKLDIENDVNWLIVISDGYFEDGKKIPELDIISEKIREVVNKQKINPIFLLIGSNEAELDTYEEQEGIKIWKEIFGSGEYPKIYKSVGKKDIVEKMNYIAQLLTNKSTPTEKNYEIKGNKIVFSPLFPLNKIILLDQEVGKENEIVRITVGNSKIENLKIYSPKKSAKNLNLNGNIIHIDSQDNKLLNKGELVIEFKNKVPENIRLYPEVAGKFLVTLYDEKGVEIKERFNKIEEGTELSIVGKIKNIKTNEALKYIEGTKVIINYGGEKIQLDYNPDNQTYEANLKVLRDKKSIDAIAEYEGYFYYQSDIYIVEGTPEKKREIKVEPVIIEVPKIELPKIYTLHLIKNLETKELSQNELKDLEIKIVLKVNGEYLTEEAFKNFKIDFDSELKGKLEKNSNSWKFIPEVYDGKYGYKKPQGEYEIKVKAEKENIKLEENTSIEVKKLSFIQNYGRLIGQIIVAIIAIVVIIGHITKKRFEKKAKIVLREYKEDFSKPDSYKKLKASLGNNLIPFVPNSMNIDGIKFIANGRSLILNGENLAKKFGISRVKKVYINGDLVEKEEIGKRLRYSLYNENSIKVIYDDKLIREYIYQKN